MRVLELDWFGRTYGWPPDVVLRQPRALMRDLRTLRSARKALGGSSG